MRTIAPSKKGYMMPEVKVRFPPEITPIELTKKAIAKLETSGQTSRIPNAFIAYRMAFHKELHSIKHPVITQPQLSALVKQSWLKEEEHVRREYQRIAKEAKDLYVQICREQSPHFITNMLSVDDEYYYPSDTKNDSDTLDFNFDLFNSNEIFLSSMQPVAKDQQSDSHEKSTTSTSPNVTNTTSVSPSVTNTTFASPNVTNITSTSPNVTNTTSTSPNVTNVFDTDNLITNIFDTENLTPELLTSQYLFSSILSIQSDFSSVPIIDKLVFR
ncbi:3636_t:CDS:2 [Ambispora gerdemannii]|uniref:3636_t:CDS:1 n=1 Tax=Ambispora gerdemannii TaxID=144530 RepID=A0A9N9AA05_9GLOM|nr:3636_t:CDS:2 [Ambispora gerdemannii]